MSTCKHKKERKKEIEMTKNNQGRDHQLKDAKNKTKRTKKKTNKTNGHLLLAIELDEKIGTIFNLWEKRF